MEIEVHGVVDERKSVAHVLASAGVLNGVHEGVRGEGLLDRPLQIAGRDLEAALSAGRAETVLKSEGTVVNDEVVGLLSVGSEDRVELVDDGSDGEVAVVVVALDPPQETP